ncbi:hypothetical protein ACIPC2_13000 [Curtobacterium pusillum]|uniref:hypothetical protein n=1 Tax=Curtobacterium pusillum TaxID=69373 RepID=UPI0037F25612
MNTEPPEGDDLQRMLVSMKQNVLERATPRPKRRRFRPGVALGIVGLLAVGTATGAVALSLSQQEQPTAAPTQTQQPEPAPSATTPTSAPITATPRPTSTPRPSATPVTSKWIPGLCSDLVPSADYDRFFGAATHETFIWGPDGSREVEGNDRIQGLRDPEESLYCSWQNEGVIAQIVITVGRVTPEQSLGAEQDAMTGDGTCADGHGGRVCRFTLRVDDGPSPVSTVFLRDDLVIRITQTDFPTDNLLGAIVGEIWGD